MKKKVFTLSFLIAFACILGVSAETWIVDNSEGSNIASFTSLQAAIDTSIVASGDTLMIIGSVTSYGNVIFTKELHVFGTGYRLNENNLVSPNGMYSKLGNISFIEGSSNSSIEGIQAGEVDVNDSSITITKCHLGKTYCGNNKGVNNIVITSSYIEYLSINADYRSTIITNILISNCIIYYYSNNRSLYMSAGRGKIDNVLITNTYFKYDIVLDNVTFVNNIIDREYSSLSSIVHYNACDGTQLPATDNNIQNVDLSAVFLGADSSSFDGMYQNRHDSPIAGMGQLGIDIGPFGGETPYILSGMPSLPAILQFDAIPVVTDELEFMIKVKSYR